MIQLGETVDSKREICFSLRTTTNGLVTGHSWSAGEIQICGPGGSGGTGYSNADQTRVKERGNSDYAYPLTDTQANTPGVWTIFVAVAGCNSFTVSDEVRDFASAAVVSSAQTAINGHTDSTVSSAQTAINGHTDSTVSSAQTAINSHTDTAGTSTQTVVNGHTDSALTTTQTTINAHTDTATGGIAAAVWDVVRASHATVGTFGEGVGVVSIATAAANTVRDALLNFSHRSGRTFKGWMRRVDAFVTNAATGLKGTSPTFMQPDGTTTEYSMTLDTTAGARSAPVVTNSES